MKIIKVINCSRCPYEGIIKFPDLEAASYCTKLGWKESYRIEDLTTTLKECPLMNADDFVKEQIERDALLNTPLTDYVIYYPWKYTKNGCPDVIRCEHCKDQICQDPDIPTKVGCISTQLFYERRSYMWVERYEKQQKKGGDKR